MGWIFFHISDVRLKDAAIVSIAGKKFLRANILIVSLHKCQCGSGGHSHNYLRICFVLGRLYNGELVFFLEDDNAFCHQTKSASTIDPCILPFAFECKENRRKIFLPTVRKPNTKIINFCYFIDLYIAPLSTYINTLRMVHIYKKHI